MEEHNGKIEHRLTKLEGCQDYMQEDIAHIKRQVDNHIPTSISKLDEKLDSYISKSNTQFVSILITLLLLLVGTIINLIVNKVI
jgi:hypothetical protein